MKKFNFSVDYRVIVIIVMLILAVILSFYFYFVLQTGVLFTHFFYIPIILSCLWWKYKGLVVSFILIGLTILLPIPVGFELFIMNNLIRSAVFLTVGIVTAVLSNEISQSHYELKERVRILKCIQGITNLLKNPNNSVEDILKESLTHIKCASQHPKKTCVKIWFNEKTYMTENYQKTPWQISNKVKISNKELTIYVNYLDELSFLDMEKDLIKEVSEELRAVFEFKLEWLS